jgi:hypothetical protein
MISFGVEPERLVITGCRAERMLSANGAEVRSRLGLPQDNGVMLATNNIPRANWRATGLHFWEALHDSDTYTGVVRLHPLNGLVITKGSIALRVAPFLRSHEWSLEESLAACDLVVSHNSGCGQRCAC